MATDGPEETTVSESGMVTIPAAIRRRLDIDAGDTIRWTVEGDELGITVVRQREGAFDDFEPVDVGPTDAVEIEREFGEH